MNTHNANSQRDGGTKGVPSKRPHTTDRLARQKPLFLAYQVHVVFLRDWLASTRLRASLLGEDLECERDALAAADAQSDDPAFETVAVHRVDQAGRQHRARRPNRMAMRDRTTLDIDDILLQTELARHDDRDRREGLVDLDPLDFAEFPPGAVERLRTAGMGPSPNIAGSTAAMPYETRPAARPRLRRSAKS